MRFRLSLSPFCCGKVVLHLCKPSLNSLYHPAHHHVKTYSQLNSWHPCSFGLNKSHHDWGRDLTNASLLVISLIASAVIPPCSPAPPIALDAPPGERFASQRATIPVSASALASGADGCAATSYNFWAASASWPFSPWRPEGSTNLSSPVHRNIGDNARRATKGSATSRWPNT